MKIKIFRCRYNNINNNYNNNNNYDETIINNWIKDNNIYIIKFKQSIIENIDTIIYTFLYYEKKELRKTKLEKINEL